MAKLVAFYSRADENYFGGTMPMAVFTFLEQFDWSGKKIYPFVTHEGSGFGRSENDLKKTCRGASIQKGFSVQGSMAEHAKSNVENWLKGIM